MSMILMLLSFKTNAHAHKSKTCVRNDEKLHEIANEIGVLMCLDGGTEKTVTICEH